MLQLKIPNMATKILCAAAKTQGSQIKKKKKSTTVEKGRINIGLA